MNRNIIWGAKVYGFFLTIGLLVLQIWSGELLQTIEVIKGIII